MMQGPILSFLHFSKERRWCNNSNHIYRSCESTTRCSAHFATSRITGHGLDFISYAFGWRLNVSKSKDFGFFVERNIGCCRLLSSSPRLPRVRMRTSLVIAPGVPLSARRLLHGNLYISVICSSRQCRWGSYHSCPINLLLTLSLLSSLTSSSMVASVGKFGRIFLYKSCRNERLCCPVDVLAKYAFTFVYVGRLRCVGKELFYFFSWRRSSWHWRSWHWIHSLQLLHLTQPLRTRLLQTRRKCGDVELVQLAPRFCLELKEIDLNQVYTIN